MMSAKCISGSLIKKIAAFSLYCSIPHMMIELPLSQAFSKHHALEAEDAELHLKMRAKE